MFKKKDKKSSSSSSSPSNNYRDIKKHDPSYVSPNSRFYKSDVLRSQPAAGAISSLKDPLPSSDPVFVNGTDRSSPSEPQTTTAFAQNMTKSPTPSMKRQAPLPPQRKEKGKETNQCKGLTTIVNETSTRPSCALEWQETQAGSSANDTCSKVSSAEQDTSFIKPPTLDSVDSNGSTASKYVPRRKAPPPPVVPYTDAAKIDNMEQQSSHSEYVLGTTDKEETPTDSMNLCIQPTTAVKGTDLSGLKKDADAERQLSLLVRKRLDKYTLAYTALCEKKTKLAQEEEYLIRRLYEKKSLVA
eukprot:CFRG3029T1